MCVLYRLTYGRTSEYHLLNPHVWPCSYTLNTIRAFFSIKNSFFRIEWQNALKKMEITVFGRNKNEITKQTALAFGIGRIVRYISRLLENKLVKD
jgi:hypothetical protein